MRCLIPFLCLATICVSCSNPPSSVNTKENKELKTDSNSTQFTDTTFFETIDSTEIKLEATENLPLKLYSVSTLSSGADFNLGFLSLTDSYGWREDPDSTIIEAKQLKEFVAENYNLHAVRKEKRDLFFSQIGLKETDTLYILFLKEDSLAVLPVSGLPLKGMVTPYVEKNDFPVPEYYFMIGFDLEIKTKEELMNYTHPTLASISSSNPFNEGKAEQIQFEEIPESQFPKKDTSTKEYRYVKHYLYSNTEYNYFAKERGEQHLSERWVIVIRKKDNQTVFNQWFLPGEGSGINSIILDANFRDSGIWTGKILRNRPPILMGNQYQSFGCPSINILGLDEKPIYIQCDNRH